MVKACLNFQFAHVLELWCRGMKILRLLEEAHNGIFIFSD